MIRLFIARRYVVRIGTLIVLLLGFFLPPSWSQSSVSSIPASTRDEQWRQDLQFLATELPRLHANLFFQVTAEEFDEAVAELDEAIPSMQDHEVIFGMMRIVAMMGDGHTSLRAGGFRRFPLTLYWFTDGLFVTAATPEYGRALGTRLVQIGDTDIDDAFEAVSTLIAHENDPWLRERSPSFLVTPEVLQALKILPGLESGRFVFEAGPGERFALDVASVPPGQPIQFMQAPDPTVIPLPLYRRRSGEFYWFEYLSDSETLYFKYNAAAEMPSLPIDVFAQQLAAFVNSHPVERTILDVRDNGGGDSRILFRLTAGLQDRTDLGEKGRFFVIIGRRTFSSALLNAIDLHQVVGAILAGEPTGGKPNHYGEVRSFALPNSGLVVSYSVRYFQLVEGDPLSLEPEIPAPVSSDDYFAARDPVLEAILAYTP